MLTAHETRGAVWLLDRLVARLRAGGLFLDAEVVRRTGRDILAGSPPGRDPEATDIGYPDDLEMADTAVCPELIGNGTEARLA